jgi:hypothetical protein
MPVKRLASQARHSGGESHEGCGLETSRPRLDGVSWVAAWDAEAFPDRRLGRTRTEAKRLANPETDANRSRSEQRLNRVKSGEIR